MKLIELFDTLNERKQVGTLYHFTDLYGAFGILEDMKIKKNDEAADFSAHGDMFVMTSPRQGISLTRNPRLQATKNAGAAKDRPWGEVRIAIDGDKLSDRYKIEPYLDRDNSITRADDQAEELVKKNEIDISGLVLEIVFNYNLYIKDKQDYDSWVSPPDDEETKIKYLNMDRNDASLFIKTVKQKGIPLKVTNFKRKPQKVTEGRNVPCIMVDIQPAYEKYMSFDMNKLCHFMAKQNGPFLMFVNADDTGMTDDNITYDILPWWGDHFDDAGLDFTEAALQKMMFVDKGYGYFRGWMDRNVPDRFIIRLIRYMYQNGLNDIQDDLDGVYEFMNANPINIRWESWMNEEPFAINWTSVAQLKKFNQCYIMGGGRDECLREVELLMNAFNIKYKRIEEFVY